MKDWWESSIYPLLFMALIALFLCLTILFSLVGCTPVPSFSCSGFVPTEEEMNDELKFFRNSWIIILPEEERDDE